MNHLFFDDYSEGVHPELLSAVAAANEPQQLGYGKDEHCANAANLIRTKFNVSSADVHFVSGATQANFIGLSSMLRSYQGVIAADSGHIVVHEAGALEATGHKILAVPHVDGRLTITSIEKALASHEDEHTVMPKVIYITQSTELGTVYSRAQIDELVSFARDHNLYTFMDGARLAMGLAASDISMNDVGELGLDMFSIGGTKVGAMFGEAIVINNDELKPNFRYHMKQRGALLAKSRFIGVQFERYFAEDNLWLTLGAESNTRTARLAEGLSRLGIEFSLPCETNQLFVILPNTAMQELQKLYGFYRWEAHSAGFDKARLVCSWSTPWEQIELFLKDAEKLLT